MDGRRPWDAGAVPAGLIGTAARGEKGAPTILPPAGRRGAPRRRERRPPVAGGRRQVRLRGAGYFFGIIDPVCRYRVWKLKASSNMCGEWRPALGFFMARFT